MNLLGPNMLGAHSFIRVGMKVSLCDVTGQHHRKTPSVLSLSAVSTAASDQRLKLSAFHWAAHVFIVFSIQTLYSIIFILELL